LGHASSEGKDTYNLKISTDRCEAIKQYLLAQGVSEQQLSIQAFGATVPIADNTTSEGRATNRRVDIERFYVK